MFNALRATNIMKRTLRCHDFGEAPIMMSRNGNDGAVLVAIMPAQLGQNRASPQGVAATIAGAPKRGAGAPPAGMRPRRRAQDRGIGALTSRFGVASKHTTLGTCSALRGTFVARLVNTASIGFTSLRAIDDSGSQRTRVSLC